MQGESEFLANCLADLGKALIDHLPALHKLYSRNTLSWKNRRWYIEQWPFRLKNLPRGGSRNPLGDMTLGQEECKRVGFTILEAGTGLSH